MLLLKESIDHPVKLLNEASKDGFTYIKGIFAEAELQNRNGRIYPLSVMSEGVNAYVTDFVNTKRAIGEINHPSNRIDTDPSLASHLVTELTLDGSKVMGKARILPTPQGQIIEGLLKGGVNIGVSTRALGSLKESGGVKYVQPDFLLRGIDVVSQPSSINAWVDAVNENQEWVVTDDGRIVEATKKKLNKINKLSESKQLELFSDFMMQISKRKFKN